MRDERVLDREGCFAFLALERDLFISGPAAEGRRTEILESPDLIGVSDDFRVSARGTLLGIKVRIRIFPYFYFYLFFRLFFHDRSWVLEDLNVRVKNG